MMALDTPTGVGHNAGMTTNNYRVWLLREGSDHTIWLAERMKRTPVLPLTSNRAEAYVYARRADARAAQRLLGDMWIAEVDPT